jgi:VWFA-related protein
MLVLLSKHAHSRQLPRALLSLLLFASVAIALPAQTPPPATPPSSSPAPVVDPSASKPAAPQSPASAADTKPAPKSDTKTEVAIQDSGTTFHLRVNLVQVHVVVRDPKGNPVENLRKEDFLLYDQGKLQPITTFATETRQTRLAKAEEAAKTQVDDNVEPGKAPSPVLPDRFVAISFDDVHMALDETNFVRGQVDKFLDGLAPTDRAAIYSTSGELTHNFTSDKDALKKTLLGLVPRPKFAQTSSDCPDVSAYEADQAENKHNTQVFQVVVEETLQCAFNGDTRQLGAAQQLAQSAIQRTLSQTDVENEFLYSYTADILRRLAGMPGERVLVMISPGFLVTTQFSERSSLIDQANRSGIVINTIDSRGLYAPDLMGDITRQSSDTYRTIGSKAGYRIAAQTEQAYILGDWAYGTGGTFFHNSNDLTAGLKMVGSAPEVSYVLGFSPQNQKMDGQFHNLKVTLSQKGKHSVQARRGYFAPRKVDDPAQQAKQEIQEAVFSRDEIMELPLQLQTQYFKVDDASVHLSVVSRLDLKGIHFRKADGRNLDNLVVATVIFDDNGNFVAGGEKLVTMKLLDTTYEKLVRSGLTVKSSFDVKPGRYMIRQVVRDSEGAQMAARNGAVEIPY